MDDPVVFNTYDPGAVRRDKLNKLSKQFSESVGEIGEVADRVADDAAAAEQSRQDAEGFKNQAEVAATNAANDVRSELEDVRDETEGFRDETALIKADFETAFGGLSYLAPVEYGSGIEIDSAVKTVEYDGDVYAPLPSEVPFTTSGTFESDKFRLIQGVTTQQMASTAGAGFAANIGRNVIAVDSIADLLALPAGVRRGDLRYLVKGYHAGSDVGGGEFYWDAASTDADNGGTVFAVAGVATGRFVRRFDGAVDVTWFGAKGDGVADDVSAIQAAINSVDTSDTVFFPPGVFGIGQPIEWTKRVRLHGSGTRFRTRIKALAEMTAMIDGSLENSDSNTQSFSEFIGIELFCNKLAEHGIRGATNHSRFDIEIVGQTEIGAHIRYGWNNGGRIKTYAASGSGIFLESNGNANKWDVLEAFNLGGYGVSVVGAKGTTISLLVTEKTGGPGVLSRINESLRIETWYCETACEGGDYVYTVGSVNSPFHSIGGGFSDVMSFAIGDNFSIGTVFIVPNNDITHDCLFFVPGAIAANIGDIYINDRSGGTNLCPVVGIYDQTSTTSRTNGSLGKLVVGSVTTDSKTPVDNFTVVDATQEAYFLAPDAEFCRFANVRSPFNYLPKTMGDWSLVVSSNGGTWSQSTDKFPSRPYENVYELIHESANSSHIYGFTIDPSEQTELAGEWVVFRFWSMAESGINSLAYVNNVLSRTLNGSGAWVFGQLLLKVPEETSATIGVRKSGASGKILIAMPTLHKVGSNPFSI